MFPKSQQVVPATLIQNSAHPEENTSNEKLSDILSFSQIVKIFTDKTVSIY